MYRASLQLSSQHHPGVSQFLQTFGGGGIHCSWWNPVQLSCCCGGDLARFGRGGHCIGIAKPFDIAAKGKERPPEPTQYEPETTHNTPPKHQSRSPARNLRSGRDSSFLLFRPNFWP
jgi:hypothetical protein